MCVVLLVHVCMRVFMFIYSKAFQSSSEVSAHQRTLAHAAWRQSLVNCLVFVSRRETTRRMPCFICLP